jgi:hypothetical protein
MARFQAEDAGNGRSGVPYVSVLVGAGALVVLVVVGVLVVLVVVGVLVVLVVVGVLVVLGVLVGDDGSVVVAAVVVVARLEVVAATVSTTSWGAVRPVSRLAYRPADLSSAVSTKSITPSPWTSAVTSTLVQLSRATGPEVATTGPGVGAVA